MKRPSQEDALDSETTHRAPAPGPRRVLVIACGALAREVLALRLDPSTSPACRRACTTGPSRIPEAMRAKIRASRPAYDEILCLYGDCGTGGELDRVLEEEGVRRIEGAHCYAFYAGEEAFARLMDEEQGTFYPHRFSRPPFRRAGHPRAWPRSLSSIARRLFRQLPPASCISPSSTTPERTRRPGGG